MNNTNKTRLRKSVNYRTNMTVADINTIPNTKLWGFFIGKPQSPV